MRISSGSAQPLHSIKGSLIANAALLGGNDTVALACVLPLGGVVLLCARNVLMETRARGKCVLYLLPLHIPFSLVLPLVALQEGRVAPSGADPRTFFLAKKKTKNSYFEMAFKTSKNELEL